MGKILKTFKDGVLVSTENVPELPAPSLGERKAAIAAYFTGNEGRSLLLEVLDEATGKLPGKTLADILAKVT